MNSPPTSRLAVTGARVLSEDGRFERDERLSIDGASFSAEHSPSDETVLDGSAAWVIPGVYDCHCHISWNDFHEADRARRSPEERARQMADSLARTLRAGVTSVRDAGGATASAAKAIESGELLGPRLYVSIDMIGASDAGGAARITAAVERALDKGAQWIKLVATTGVATPSASILEPTLSREEIVAATRRASDAGVRVMVHTWGGPSLDWALEAGAASVEHGIYLTPEQARRLADASVTFVPTLSIYRYVRDLVVAGELTGVPLERINRVVDVHVRAVRAAADAGATLALGSDFTTPQQHGTNLVEIASLMRAGLSATEALRAAGPTAPPCSATSAVASSRRATAPTRCCSRATPRTPRPSSGPKAWWG